MSEERRTLLILAILFVAMVIAVIIAARKGRLDQLLPTDPVDELDDDPGDTYLNSRKPQKGDRRWSRFFGSMIEMRTYKNDSTYSFKILTGPYAGSVGQSQSPWSSLPLWRPDDAPAEPHRVGHRP